MVEQPLITRDPDVLGGIPVFAGTRVPIQTLLDYLKAGDSLDMFLDDFPTVSHDHATAILEFAKHILMTSVYERAA